MGAAKLIGLEQVPTIRLASLTPSQVRAYVIADNRISLDSGWNEELLKIELEKLIAADEIDISLTGLRSPRSISSYTGTLSDSMRTTNYPNS